MHEMTENPETMRSEARGSSPMVRNFALLAVGLGCTLGYARMCSLGFVGYLTYEMSSELDSWYVLRVVVELATLAFLALAGRNAWFKLGLKSLVTATVCAMASAIVFAVDTLGILGPVVAVLGGVSMALLMYVWMLVLSGQPVRVIVGASCVAFLLAGAIIEGAPLVGPDVGLILAVFAAFVSGAAAVLLDPDLRSCTPDGPLGPSERLRIPWLTVVMVVACGFFATVLYGVAEYMTWLYDWQPNYIVFGVATIAAVGATVAVMLGTRAWMHTAWVPLFALFALAIVFSCLPVRSMLQIAVGLMMAAVFCAVFLDWIIFPALFSTLKVPRAFAAGVLLVCVNSQLASLVGDALGSALPRSMQNLGSVAGIMAIVVAILFAIVFVANRGRQGAAGAWPIDERELAEDTRSTDVSLTERASEGEALVAVPDSTEVPDRSISPALEEPEAEPSNPADALKARLDDLVGQYGLTPREAEVALFTVQGFSCAYIAEKLVVSNSTVRFHQQNIYRKFDVHSRNELIEVVSAE